MRAEAEAGVTQRHAKAPQGLWPPPEPRGEGGFCGGSGSTLLPTPGIWTSSLQNERIHFRHIKPPSVQYICYGSPRKPTQVPILITVSTSIGTWSIYLERREEGGKEKRRKKIKLPLP